MKHEMVKQKSRHIYTHTLEYSAQKAGQAGLHLSDCVV